MKNDLIENIGRLHTTEMGADRKEFEKQYMGMYTDTTVKNR